MAKFERLPKRIEHLAFFCEHPVGMTALRNLCEELEDNDAHQFIKVLSVISGAPECHRIVETAGFVPDEWDIESLGRPNELEVSEASLGLSCHYGLLDAEVVESLPVLNLHASSLPSYRGPDPLAWQLRDDRESIGLSAHLIDLKPDAGVLVAQGSVPLDRNLPLEDIEETVCAALGGLVADILMARTAPTYQTLNAPANSYYPASPLPESLQSAPAHKVSEYLRRPRCAFVAADPETMLEMADVIRDAARGHLVECFVPTANEVDAVERVLSDVLTVIHAGDQLWQRLGRDRLNFHWVCIGGTSSYCFEALALCQYSKLPCFYFGHDQDTFGKRRKERAMHSLVYKAVHTPGALKDAVHQYEEKITEETKPAPGASEGGKRPSSQTRDTENAR